MLFDISRNDFLNSFSSNSFPFEELTPVKETTSVTATRRRVTKFAFGDDIMWDSRIEKLVVFGPNEDDLLHARLTI